MQLSCILTSTTIFELSMNHDSSDVVSTVRIPAQRAKQECRFFDIVLPHQAQILTDMKGREQVPKSKLRIIKQLTVDSG